MALLTDGNPNDTPALQVYEVGILGVANVEGIDLNVKLGLATVELSAIILDVLLDHAWTPDPQTNIRRRTGVSDVVVSPQMTRWHALHTLAIVSTSTGTSRSGTSTGRCRGTRRKKPCGSESGWH